MKTFLEALRSIFVIAILVLALLAGYLIWSKVMGNPANFEGGNPEGAALQGNYLGIVYKGGFVVPVLIAVNLIVITFVIERFIMLSIASGRGSLAKFVRKFQNLLNEDKIEEASALCDKQRSSLANVMKAALDRYRELQNDKTLENDQKVVSLQKHLEEATALELPVLSRNIPVIATIVSASVLIGLFGTVLGMIRAFGALATAGAPDALALSEGISEALVNTAFGILGSVLALIFYNVFTTKIDNMTYKIDEAGFSLVQTFSASLK
ncbi:MAG: MotA/TolQ/ExbB proton channel family protein [Bacteroidales bacterium]|nr:MotA/TolQ/ExbB proton channel family protein [Bacteroidales bacterium]